MSTRRLGKGGAASGSRLPATGNPDASYQASAPSDPQVGDLWVDSDATSSALNSSDYLTKAEAATLYAAIDYADYDEFLLMGA